MKIENKYKVKNLIYTAKAFVFCPLGQDWGRVNIEADIVPGEFIPDYCDVDNFILKNIEGGGTHYGRSRLACI